MEKVRIARQGLRRVAEVIVGDVVKSALAQILSDRIGVREIHHVKENAFSNRTTANRSIKGVQVDAQCPHASRLPVGSNVFLVACSVNVIPRKVDRSLESGVVEIG